MSLFGRKEREEIERLRAQMSPEQKELYNIQQTIQTAKAELENLKNDLAKKKQSLSSLQEKIIETDEAVLLQSFGVYTPHHSYAMSDEYKEKIKSIRDQQKEMIKAGIAVTGYNNWQVNGSAANGKKMVKDMQKLLLRAFNTECDDAIEHVRFNNIEASEKKIRSSADAISKLGNMMGIVISTKYLGLKIEELFLMHEYQIKKQNEKEEAKEIRQRQREEAKALKELEEERKKLEKEHTHYENAILRLNEQLGSAPDLEKEAIREKINQMEKTLREVKTSIEQVDYRTANQRAGYVYIISNIGAFGENIYKIGMTRRLDPMERVDELGDASVPFNFDVHAMIFTDDAPKLETALHTAFENRKVNFVNHRREFFAVTLDEIKEVVKNNYDKTVEFIDVAPAEQYRESLKLKECIL